MEFELSNPTDRIVYYCSEKPDICSMIKFVRKKVSHVSPKDIKDI